MDDSAHRQRAASVALIAAALIVVALGTWGRLNPGDLVWVGRLLDHPVAFGTIALLLAAWGLARLTGRRWVQVLVLTGAVLVAAAWALVGSVLVALSGDGEIVATESAPDAAYVAVVRSTSSGFIDPAWVVSIRQTSGLTAREHEIGCLDGDDPEGTFRAVRWIDAERLEVRTSGHVAIVRVDPATGRPVAVRGDAWGC